MHDETLVRSEPEIKGVLYTNVIVKWVDQLISAAILQFQVKSYSNIRKNNSLKSIFIWCKIVFSTNLKLFTENSLTYREYFFLRWN